MVAALGGTTSAGSRLALRTRIRDETSPAGAEFRSDPADHTGCQARIVSELASCPPAACFVGVDRLLLERVWANRRSNIHSHF